MQQSPDIGNLVEKSGVNKNDMFWNNWRKPHNSKKNRVRKVPCFHGLSFYEPEIQDIED